jgi:solute carrier family 25 protein 34/35
MDAAILRTAMGSSVRTFILQRHSSVSTLSQVQLPSYNFTKDQLVKNGFLPANSIWTYLASSSVSGVCVVIITSFAALSFSELT